MKERRLPVPLRSPRGTVYAYACAYCHRVCIGGSTCGGRDNLQNRNHHREQSQQDAARHGVCRDCGHFDPKHTEWDAHRCTVCDAKRRAEESERAAVEGTWLHCIACLGSGEERVTLDDGRTAVADCAACEGCGSIRALPTEVRP